MARAADGGARRQRGALDVAEVGLIAIDLADLVMTEARFDVDGLVRDQRRQPIFIRESQPTPGALEILLAALGDAGILRLLEMAAENADQPLMQDVVTGG